MALWDYIIVGGGLAGCTISNRLLELNSTSKILVIEAGGDPGNRTDILYANATQGVGGIYDWNDTTTAQPGLNNRTISLAQGRGLGGGTIINKAAWTRGNAIDYDLWGEAVNDSRWTYDGLLPYFKKTEHYWNKTINPEDHGYDGNLWIQTITSTNRRYPLYDYELEAWSELNISRLPYLDANTGRPNGMGEVNENRHEGRRQTSCSVYSQAGITVQADTLVEKILLGNSSRGLSAYGVQLANGSKVLAGRDTIVSAGAIRTPQLLMLSGIGPTAELARHGIRLVLDLPDVGEHLADHTISHYEWRLRDPGAGWVPGSGNPLFDEPQYGLGLPYEFFVSTSTSSSGLAAAIEADEGGAAPPDPAAHPLLRRLDERTFFEHALYFGGGSGGSSVVTTVAAHLLPTSRGSVRLASADAADRPLVDPNYLATAVDRWVMREGVRLQVALLNGGATVLGRDVFDGEHVSAADGFFTEPLTADSSDAYVDARARAAAGSCYHPMGTAAMGKVVDTDLRVKGVRNLRVVDASVFPVVIASHLQVAVYALAEQAALIIAGAD